MIPPMVSSYLSELYVKMAECHEGRSVVRSSVANLYCTTGPSRAWHQRGIGAEVRRSGHFRDKESSRSPPLQLAEDFEQIVPTEQWVLKNAYGQAIRASSSFILVLFHNCADGLIGPPDMFRRIIEH